MVGLTVTPLRLDAGFDVHLHWVEMTLTYGGLIEGVPRQRMNDELFIGRTMEQTRGKWTQYPVHLIPPSRTIPDNHQRFDRHGPHPYGLVEYLPPVQCIGLFEAGIPNAESSCLVVIWFQDHSDTLIHPEAATELRRIPWDDLARDFGFDAPL